MLIASHIANAPAIAADRSMRPIVWQGTVRVSGFGGSADRGVNCGGTDLQRSESRRSTRKPD